MKKKKKQKVDTIEKLAILMVEGFEQVDKRFEQVDKRFEQVDKRFDRVETRLEGVELQLKDVKGELSYFRHEVAEIRQRIEHLEELGARNAGFAKEIDYLLERVGKIEKHLHRA
ncbi:hypothetical protein A2673_03440 [Candidatus Kaiserbacteria bacterium RIFCSPHIGHO2_01_FULL_50_13]|uniref:t-SNARE coiled-coil homology domain-containing protein n=1 Tax=Candidatus Kaiserbacteria bacterium RIFCSPLOWO2_01_FULL_50_24 TaxID=1798507 RepID=A0A1F6ENI9_9BACT|nr:MAG: hypothetical protein A2673_03440 [Candidatus Kaiserbacteria bacterium RIFCSPHIGHO2_01_FULL_50_13]OGG74882.1 MAG: hypothetical protein A3A34_03620 [Candidatus Kaiserbacteria bacterium RIFCSPLOWO2_01_FULL_50_24]OGG81619.1 MAG: hypothetical protein A3H74_01400 [Candidatus Kaiserbacteria bacterium RIFCSPLOWO2_02_FULL_51_13]